LSSAATLLWSTCWHTLSRLSSASSSAKFPCEHDEREDEFQCEQYFSIVNPSSCYSKNEDKMQDQTRDPVLITLRSLTLVDVASRLHFCLTSSRADILSAAAANFLE
jgi:hypothetical protein